MSASRLRVLYIVKNYPQLSQTYIKTELRALGDRYDLRIISTSVPNYPDPDTLPYVHLAELNDVIAEARRFQPDVIHGHYLVQTSIIRKVAEALDRPFTIRAHSFDALVPGTAVKLPKHMLDLPRQLNDDLCLGVLAMPFAKPILVERAKVSPDKVIESPPVVDFEYFYNREPNTGGVMNTGACIPKKSMGDFLAVAANMRDTAFDIYAIGHDIDELTEMNVARGNPVIIHTPVPYAEMPAVYKQHRWLLYTACFRLKTVGWPMAVAEAMASGVVVCMARIRPDVDDYLAEAGYTYETLEEAEAILKRGPDEAMRQRGFERARELDIRKHLPLLTDMWETAAARGHASMPAPGIWPARRARRSATLWRRLQETLGLAGRIGVSETKTRSLPRDRRHT